MTGYTVFLFLMQNIDCGYWLGQPRQGSSNMCPQSMFCEKKKKKINWKCSILKLKTLYKHKLSNILQQHEKSVFEQYNLNIISHPTNWTHQNFDLPEVFSTKEIICTF